MSGKPQKHVHKINNCPIAASKAVPGSSLYADISALNDKLSTKKDRQDPVASPDADGSGIAFIDTVSQNANGKITVTKKNVQQASTSSAGIVQLSSKIDSTSETMAATPKAVHDAIIEAEQATVAGLNAENTVPDGHYITSVDETDGIVSITTAAMDDVPTQDSSRPVKSGGVYGSIKDEQDARSAFDTWVNALIPEASKIDPMNQLADKAYVDAIGERVEARYLSYSYSEETGGLPFPSYASFVAAQQSNTFYYIDKLTIPNNNDVIVITADETHPNDNGQPCTTRYRFFESEDNPGTGEWRFEYVINNSALNYEQLLAINSGITADKVENYDAHLKDHANPHQVTAAQVGLGNVDNTADLDKPISTATQTALDEKADNVVDGTANHIVVLGDNGKTLVDSHAAITSSYDGTDEINPVTGSAVAAAIGELDAGPFGGEGRYIVSVSETAGVVTATEGTLDAEPTENSTNPVKSGGVHQHLSTKADKDTDAVEDNVAVFDRNGNPVDSGISKDDLEAAISSAGSSVQGVSIDGTALTPGANNVVDIPLATTSADGAMSADDKAKLDGIASGAEVNVQADWSETNSESDAFIKNKPNLATVATTGEYGDLLHIPTDLVHDASYVHTDNNYTDEEKVKLAGVESGAEVNVQSDWTESDSNSDAFIKNKPENLVQDADYVHTDNNYTTAEKEKIAGIEDGAEVNVQADWTESDSTSDAFIKNKPTIPAAQVNSDWNATSGVARILNRPNLATVATSGSYNDLADKPVIPEILVTDVTVNGTSVVDTDCVAKVVIPAQQQADWNQSTTSAVDFIKNKPDLTVYATKVGSATSGNFAALDTNGNLSDSGHKHSDYKTKQESKSSPPASGSTLAFIDTVDQDANGVITATKKNVTIDSTLSSTSTNPVQNKAVDAALSGKADKATNLTGATKTKITYNSQGIVTAGADLEASDIPNLDASKITSGTLPVERGGTGSSTIEGVRTNLDVYSKSEVDARLTGRIEVVSMLPTTGEAGVTYYVGPQGSGDDQYEEYIWAKKDGASTESWIKVGDRTIDLSGYKTKQTAKASPTASGNTLSFIDTVSQNENGEITATKKTIQSASGTQDGVMSSSHYTKLEGISTGANKVEASTTNGNIKIDGTETTVYTHPTDGADTSKGDTTNQTPAFGGTFNVTSETVDAMGHTTVLSEHTVKIPNATAVASTEGTGGSAGLMSAADKEKLNGIATGAEVNQNAFSNVKVGSTTVAADSKADTLELASSSAITLTPDAANDKVTIGVSTMGAASSSAAGTAGIVPAPGAGKQTSFLRGDGTWAVPTNTDTLVKATAKTDNVNYKILATASASPTSGNATEAVYDTDISLNPSTNTITSNISGNAATATKPAVTTLTASDNLNNVGGSTDGDVLWYKWASGSAPANVPIAGSAVMEVVRTHSNKYITQTVYTTDHSVYRRECINGTWGAWYAYSKSTHTHGNITSGGSLQTTDVAIANGDKLVITDASDSNKVARSSTAFDGSTITKALTQKGTFESVVLADDAMPLSAADGVKITYSGSTATISGNFAAGAGVDITYANNVATFSADISAIPLATIYALS